MWRSLCVRCAGSVSIDELIAFVAKANGEFEEARNYTQQVPHALTRAQSTATMRNTLTRSVRYVCPTGYQADGNWRQRRRDHAERLRQGAQSRPGLVRLASGPVAAQPGASVPSACALAPVLPDAYTMREYTRPFACQAQLRKAFADLQIRHPHFTITALLEAWQAMRTAAHEENKRMDLSAHCISLKELEHWMARTFHVDQGAPCAAGSSRATRAVSHVG